MNPVELQITIPGSNVVVSGLWNRPADCRAALLLAHGAGAGMRHSFMERLAHGLGQKQIATLRFHFPYMEMRKKVPDRPAVLCDTIRAALHRLAELSDDMPIFAGGKSLGGRMTSTLLAREPIAQVKALVFFGFPLHPAGQPATTRGDHLRSVHCPMLFIQGTRDKLAEMDLILPLVESLGQRATLHVVQDADHSFHVPKSTGRTDDQVLGEIAEKVRSWLLSQK